MQAGIALCTAADVYDVWSQTGAQARYDDDLSGVPAAAPELLMLDRMIQRASSFVSSKLRDRYKMADFQGSAPPTDTPISVNWYASIVAAYYTAIRKGLPCPQGIAGLYELALKELDLVRTGQMSLAEVNDSFDTLPFVVNQHVDTNYRDAKLRKIIALSTTSPPAPNSGRKSYTDDSSLGGGMFID